jgi:cation transport ATPase
VLAELVTEERLRSDAAREVEALVADGLEVWMLTGDQRERALAVARATGIDEQPRRSPTRAPKRRPRSSRPSIAAIRS